MSEAIKANGISIVLDPEPPNYLPGETVTGRVIVTCPWGVEAKGLSISLQGEIHISYERYDGSTTHWYTEDEDLLDLSETLLGGIHNLPPGEHDYPFSLHLPHHGLPASASCHKGHVEYALNANLVHPIGHWKANLVILIFPLNDIRPLTGLQNPVEDSSETASGCCYGGQPMKLWCGLNKTGFFPGDVIQFRVTLDNAQDMHVDSFWGNLVQNFTVRADGWHSQATTTVASVNHWARELKTSNRGQYFWEGELLVPVCAPSGLQKSLISMNYTFNVFAVVKGCGQADNPTASFEVMIGSLPVKETAAAIAPSQKS